MAEEKAQAHQAAQQESKSCHVSDADFTPNPSRAIWIRGEINGGLLDRLQPEILELTSQNRDPITLFIDSAGGSAAIAESLLYLLKTTNQDAPSTCRIITVAVSKALSAAADLLSAGDFAMAHPGSKLLYHGTGFLRTRSNDSQPTRLPEPVIGKWAGLVREALTSANERSAAELTRDCSRRFQFIVFALRGTFEQHRADAGDSSLTDLHCFQAILRRKLSPSGQQVLDKAITRLNSYNDLLTHFHKKIGRVRPSGQADLQKIMLNASIASEYKNGGCDPNWSLNSEGFSRIRDYFSFFGEYFQNANGDEVRQLCECGAPVISSKEEEVWSSLETNGRTSAYFLPFRAFLIALCRALQEGENQVTAADALWLGLIDTLRADLPALSAS